MTRMLQKQGALLPAMILFILPCCCWAFAPLSTASPVLSLSRQSGTSRLHLSKDDSDFADFPDDEKVGYSGTVDWDAEWKKVVENGDTLKKDRPSPYKSDAEIAAIRAANKARAETIKVVSEMPSAPSFDDVKSDWKFWVGVLAVISIGTSLWSASGGMVAEVPPPNDSYYI